MIIEVVDYDPSWPGKFEDEKAQLKQALGNCLVATHHIGSTAVEGLAAKPIIDILIEVTDLAVLDSHNDAMIAMRYAPRGESGIPGRRYYRKGGAKRTHQVHAFEQGSDHVHRHIAFRDYLRSNPEISKEYAQLKRESASLSGDDIALYCEMKDAYVKHHEAIAVRLTTK